MLESSSILAAVNTNFFPRSVTKVLLPSAFWTNVTLWRGGLRNFDCAIGYDSLSPTDLRNLDCGIGYDSLPPTDLRNFIGAKLGGDLNTPKMARKMMIAMNKTKIMQANSRTLQNVGLALFTSAAPHPEKAVFRAGSLSVVVGGCTSDS